MTSQATGTTTASARLFAEACELLPGGVSSPARAFKSVGGTPRFIASGSGAYVTDVDGNRYVDYVLSFGPHILGHAPAAVLRAIGESAAAGVSFGAPTVHELELAREINRMMPSLELVRFVNSGTEAVMSALRLARAFTGRDLIVKFEGHYHGHADTMLARAGSAVATLSQPDSPGVPASAAAQTIVVPFNDADSVRQVFSEQGERIAALIVEPVAGNMGVVLPAPGFLQMLRTVTREHGALLIFDEVMSGFRVHLAGAQALYGVTPDLTTLGKVIGGGLPVGAYGGRREIMSMVAPSGPVYQAGTMSGNPVAMAAGRAVLDALRTPDAWHRIARSTQRLAQGLRAAAKSAGIEVQVPTAGTMLSVYFSATPVTDWTTAAATSSSRFAPFFHSMLEQGVYLPPSPYEAWFVSSAHDDEAIDATVRAAATAFRLAR
ncbi:MAG TPA: glutamate-1-semialdehyde 2,1-aminomutase [Gemmatimonadaceae bacterium]|nr:glutamate-1-semialdehyde 2,1-aminomutase [Gemmatimonadaceae bacterium]